MRGRVEKSAENKGLGGTGKDRRNDREIAGKGDGKS